MTNQNDNRIAALRNEAEALNTLMTEFQNKLNSLDISPDELVSVSYTHLTLPTSDLV